MHDMFHYSPNAGFDIRLTFESYRNLEVPNASSRSNGALCCLNVVLLSVFRRTAGLHDMSSAGCDEGRDCEMKALGHQESTKNI